MWTFESLGKVFDVLGKFTRSKYLAKGVEIVRAIVELGLTMPAEDLNAIFNHPATEQFDATYQEKRDFFVSRVLDFTSSGRHTNFINFYKSVFGKKFGDDQGNHHKTFTDGARLLLSWFTTYILLNVFGKYKVLFENSLVI